MLSRLLFHNVALEAIISLQLPACSSAFCGGYLGSGSVNSYQGPVTPFQEGQPSGRGEVWCCALYTGCWARLHQLGCGACTLGV